MATCYLSCAVSGTCFYSTSAPSNLPPANSSNSNFLVVRYCCTNGVSSTRFCCSDVSLAVSASSSDNPPDSCLQGPWSSWRMISMAFGFVTILMLVFVICHSAKRWRRLRLLRAGRTRSDAGSRESSNAGNNTSSLWDNWACDRSPIATVSSSSAVASSYVRGPSSLTGQFVPPPCYASLQPLPADYYKSLPPSYQEVIERTESTPSPPQTSTNHPSALSPAASSHPASSSASDTISSAIASTIAAINDGPNTSTNVNPNRPEVGTTRATVDVTDGGLVNQAADLDDEPPAYNLSEMHMTVVGGGSEVSMPPLEGAVTSTATPHIVFNGDIVVNVSVSVNNQP